MAKSYLNTTQNEVYSADTVINKKDSKLVLANMIWVILALIIGCTACALKTFVRSRYFELPLVIVYYQILTLHGVILALVLTFFFIVGFQTAAVSRAMGGLTDGERKAGWIGFWLMTIGVLMAASMILTNQASVLYTFH